MAKRQHSYNSGRIHRAGQSQPPEKQGRPPVQDAGYREPAYTDPAYPQQGAYTKRPPARVKKKSKKGLIALLIILILGVALVGGMFAYLNGIFDTGALGAVISQGHVPKDYSKKQVVHFLVVGIDNDEDRDYGAGLGMTDMILYVSYDIVNNQVNLLQIPRDSYVGEAVPTGGTGKINAALISGEDKKNPINNLVAVVEQQFKLPVDHYLAIDMDALKALVDTFGGLYVYVPREMSFAGSYLPQGWQWLSGESVEFFVRNRKGPGFERADIDRLDNQRHFYSALFKRFLEIEPSEIPGLLPVFKEYCNTDIGLTDLFDLAFSALKLNAENVLFCKAPGATGEGLDPTGQGRDMYIIDKDGLGTEENPGLASLLNQYFRSYGDPVPAEELELPDVTIPDSVTRYPPNIQVMSGVQAEEG